MSELGHQARVEELSASRAIPSTDLWAAATHQLSEKDLKALRDLKGSADGPQELIALVERQKLDCQSKQWELKRRHGQKSIVLRDALNKITAWIQKFIEVGDVVVQYDPQHAALPWAGVRFLLKAAIADAEKYAAVVEGLERIIKLVVRCQVIENLFRGKGHSLESHLESSLVDAYASILKWLLEARRYFEKSTSSMRSIDLDEGHIVCLANFGLERILKGVAIFLDKFDEHGKRLSSCEDDIESYRRLLADAKTESFEMDMKALSLEGRGSRQKLFNVLKELSEPVWRGIAQLDEIKASLDDSSHESMLSWFSNIPHRLHHRDAFSSVLAGTGSWFLGHRKVVEWADSSFPSILWLQADPGYGKTRLLSLLVEKLLAKAVHDGSALPIFFYCTRSEREPERGECVRILQSLVRQMAVLGPSKTPLKPAYEVYANHKHEGFPANSLNQEDCVNLISRLSDSWPLTTIIVDALDECEEEQKIDFLQALEDIQDRSSGLLKILISSREDQILRPRLKDHPHITILETDNCSDIEHFVNHEVERIVKQRRLLRGIVPDSLIRKIKQTTMNRSNGMNKQITTLYFVLTDGDDRFRWASQSLAYLCTFKLRDEVEDRLGELPSNLRDLYNKMYDRQRSILLAEEVSLFESVFRLLLCLRKNFSSGEFLKALNIHCQRRNNLTREDLLDICFNFVKYDEQMDIFRFVHLSVQEYLESNVNFNLQNCHEAAALFCLRILCHDLPTQVETIQQWNISERVSQSRSHSCLDYAIRTWPFHISEVKSDRATVDLQLTLSKFLGVDSPRQSAFAVWLCDDLRYGQVEIHQVDPKTGREYYVMLMSLQRMPLKAGTCDHLLDDSRILDFVNPIFAICILNLGNLLERWLQRNPHDVNLISGPTGSSPFQKTRLVTHDEPPMMPLDLAVSWNNVECMQILRNKSAITYESSKHPGVVLPPQNFDGSDQSMRSELSQSLSSRTWFVCQLRKCLYDAANSMVLRNLTYEFQPQLLNPPQAGIGVKLEVIIVKFRQTSVFDVTSKTAKVLEAIDDIFKREANVHVETELHLLTAKPSEWEIDWTDSDDDYNFVCAYLQKAKLRLRCRTASEVLSKYGMTPHIKVELPHNRVRTCIVWTNQDEHMGKEPKLNRTSATQNVIAALENRRDTCGGLLNGVGEWFPEADFDYMPETWPDLSINDEEDVIEEDSND
ncbi:uncharacterized protein KY384_000431 [Bacidia gigantensis]|uniref:uncharacterized protein n=1 Tax=Bacidia gigantensis TaxID=2732470 RepID=UPI001D043576|nr:uncharacterized protein KY384_000431 [Bacidia gigantensis]KAG8525671.1 hypothetical protein KY384_000431 [Bacidia gigantensis]